MRPTVTTVLLVSALLCAQPSAGQESIRGSNARQRLFSDNWQVRAQARRELIDERNHMISELISAIDEKAERTSNHAFVSDAMSVLGDLRAREAIDVLVSHVAYPRTAKTDDRVFFSIAQYSVGDEGLPAIDALVKIGEPCADAVIMKIRTTTSQDERIACVGVLRRMSVPFMRERLGKAASISNEREKESVREALTLFDQWVPPKELAARVQRKLTELFETGAIGK